jgi:hypothetical protein
MAVMNAGRFSYYDPTKIPQTPGYQGSEIYDWMAELENEAYYGNWVGKQGLMGTDRQSDLARSLYGRFRQGYDASLFDNPDYAWADYLESQSGEMPKILAGIDPDSRGYSPGAYVANGQARWLPRSR